MMIKKKDFNTFAILMLEILFIELYGAMRLWSPGWFMFGYVSWMILSFIGLYQYITTLNEVCWGDDEKSYNGFIVCLLGWVTLSIYYFWWLHKQEKRICKKGREYGVYLQGGEKRVVICMLVFWIAFYASSFVANKYNDVYYVDTYGLVSDKMLMFLQTVGVISAILLAWFLTDDLNRLVLENNKRIWMSKNKLEEEAVTKDTLSNFANVSSDFTGENNLKGNLWYCTQCGHRNIEDAIFCTSCGKRK